MKPFGYFVHHQGRGHAERCAAVVNALGPARPVTIFCARDDIFPPLRAGVEICKIPSLFEPRGSEAGRMSHIPTPDTLHCAPLGWPGIREAMTAIAQWFREADPALMICDVSAELAQLSRICSVPHVVVLQHGDRSDAGHRAAFEGAAGLLAPFHADLAQPEWPREMLARICFAGGLGLGAEAPTRAVARAQLGLAQDAEITLVMSGGGGGGFSQAPIGVGARAWFGARWITIGQIARDWHATEPGNVHHKGWVEDPLVHIAAADLVISSTGNTTCQQVLATGRPWIAVPEWRYFDEQVRKAAALAQARVAHVLPYLPSSAGAWRAAIETALATHDATRQRALIGDHPARDAARWLEDLAQDLWGGSDDPSDTRPVPARIAANRQEPPVAEVSVLTIAAGRADHLRNVIRGLAVQTKPPLELVIGCMQAEPYVDLPPTPFPVHQVMVTGETLPLARARNAVASQAVGDVLVFLDVDCIPAPRLVADYAQAIPDFDGVLMGEVMYLPRGATDKGLRYAHFKSVCERHSDRRGPPAAGIEPCTDYRCFWSLNFALRRDVFALSGGFDERYVGYGGEDTDFSKGLAVAGVPLGWMRGARVYHQYHPHHMPPVHHLESILRNAELFASKWGYRTMDHWIYAFELMGLIEKAGARLRILRAASDADRALTAQQDGQPYVNTAQVIRHLKASRDREKSTTGQRIETSAHQAGLVAP